MDESDVYKQVKALKKDYFGTFLDWLYTEEVAVGIVSITDHLPLVQTLKGKRPVSGTQTTVPSSRADAIYPLASLTKLLTALLLTLIWRVFPYLSGEQWKRYSKLRYHTNPRISSLIHLFSYPEGDESHFQIPLRLKADLASKFEDIYLKDLLCHSVNLQPDSSDLLGADQSPLPTRESLILVLLERDICKGKEGKEYSNEAYALCHILIEHISGRSFTGMMEEYIFKPLGMHNSFVGASASMDIAPCYNQLSNESLERVKAPICPSSSPWVGAAGVFTTLRDWCLFQQAMIRLHSDADDSGTLKKIVDVWYPGFHINANALHFLLGTSVPDKSSYVQRCPFGLIRSAAGELGCLSLDKSIHNTSFKASKHVPEPPVIYHAGATTDFTLTNYIVLKPGNVVPFGVTVVSNSTGLVDSSPLIGQFIVHCLLTNPKHQSDVKQSVLNYVREFVPEAIGIVAAREARRSSVSSVSNDPACKIKTKPFFYRCEKTSRCLHFYEESGRLYFYERCDNHNTGRFLIGCHEDKTSLVVVPTREDGDPPLSIDYLHYPKDYPKLVPSDFDAKGMASTITHVAAKPVGDVSDARNQRVYRLQSQDEKYKVTSFAI